MTRKEVGELVKPIKEGFLSGSTDPYRRPDYEVRELSVMLTELAQMDMMEWYRYAFSREPLNGRFTDGQRQLWMEKSLACGQEYCRIICKKYDSEDPVVLARKMGLQVSYPDLPEHADRVLFAEYRIPNKIIIYQDAVEKAEKLLAQPEVLQVMTRTLDIRKLLLAHELFHYIEEQYKKEIFTRTETIRLWSVGPFHNDSTIIALSEIAAMAFAKEMTRISYAPYLMDVLLVYGYSPKEASGLYEEIVSKNSKK